MEKLYFITETFSITAVYPLIFTVNNSRKGGGGQQCRFLKSINNNGI